jgi:hypothetical protein
MSKGNQSLTARLSSRVAKEAWRRAMRTGSRTWLSVAVGAQGLRLVQRVTSPKPEVFRLKLRPGEAVEIREVRRAKKR